MVQKQFSLNSSRIFTALLLLVHGITLSALLSLPVATWIKLLVAICLLCSLVYYLRREAWLFLSTSCVSLHLDGTEIVLFTRGGMELAGTLARDSFVSPLVVILNIKIQGAPFPRSVIIFPDAIATESFRELRVALRWRS